LRQSNPFLDAPPPTEPETPDISDEVLGNDIIVRGPGSPEDLGVNPEWAPTETWPRSKVSDHRLLTIFGLHGGAGTSTVATFFGDDAVDAGQGFPIAGGWTRPLPVLNVVAVARTHYAGLMAADEFTQQWAHGLLHGSRLIGLVLVDDGPALSSGQKRAVKRLLKKTPRGGHIPWREEWRHYGPSSDQLPLRIKRLTQVLLKAAQNEDGK
jgi:hypothetical protein